MSDLCIALAGPPNAGKSTLFNGLTGGKSKVANHAGVTVETRSGFFTTPSGVRVRILDLPGVYGAGSGGADAALALRVLRRETEEAPDAMIMVADAANLRTHLQSVLQICALGLPVIIALNMIDLAKRDGVRIDIAKLSGILGVPVIAVRATRASGRLELLEALDKLSDATPVRKDYDAADIREVQRRARQIADQVLLAEPGLHQTTRILDRILLHPVIGPLLFLGILFTIFQAVFAWATVPMDMLDNGVAALSGRVAAWTDGYLRDFLTEGVIAGVGSVVIFLPQILILFSFILLLEGCGYLARISFLADELMRRCGLSGQAAIPLLSSFACAIPGIIAARAIPSERDRMVTIMIAPLMTCSARLPVYTLLVSAFISPDRVGPFNRQGLVMFSLYMAGVIGALLVAFAYKRAGLHDVRPRMLLLDLPTYKWPQWRDIYIGLRMRMATFLRRAGGMILAVSILLWLLTSFPAGAPLPDSYAGRIGALLEPLLRPIGFNLEIVIALVPGMAAREVVVGALGTIYAVSGSGGVDLASTLRDAWSFPTAMALIAWYAFAPQCMATLAVVSRETNSRKFAVFMFCYMLVMAWLAAGIVYHLTRLFV